MELFVAFQDDAASTPAIKSLAVMN